MELHIHENKYVYVNIYREKYTYIWKNTYMGIKEGKTFKVTIRFFN